ncbi:MAG: F-box protein [Alphaproteobacteria bacterium]
MCKNYSVRHFLGAGLVFVGFNIHQLEAMKSLTTNEVLPHDSLYIPNMTNGARFRVNQLSLTTDEIFPHDLIASPLNTPQKIPYVPNEIWLSIFQIPGEKHLELLKNLRLVCKNFRKLIDKNLIVPTWKNNLAHKTMKEIKAELKAFLKLSKQSKAFQLNVELPGRVISGLRQLIKEKPFSVTYLAFEGEAWGEKQLDVQRIFSSLTLTGKLEKLKISSSIQYRPLETTPLKFLSNPSLKRNISGMKALDIFMLKIPSRIPVDFLLDLPPSVKNLSLKTNITFNITQDGAPSKRLKIKHQKI